MSDSPSEVLPAATVVLVREDSGEVLFVLRHARHGFMANVWVFPGGRLDEADLAGGTLTDTELAPFVHAAIRETFEEAGILLSDPPRAALPDERRELDLALASPGQNVGPEDSRSRRFSKIEPFARWVTPPSEKRRFDTLFFLGFVPDLEAVPDHGEVIEARWLHPAHAIAEHRAGRFALAPPTLLTLHSLLGASYLAQDGYHPERDVGARWSAAHAERLAAWVASTTRPVPPLSPTLALVGGRLVVAQEPWSPWPVPAPLSRLDGIRLVDGHWELAFRDP